VSLLVVAGSAELLRRYGAMSSQATNEREILERPPPPADRRIAYGDDACHFGDLRLPSDTPRAAVIVLHGGFWKAQFDLLHIGHLCAALTEHGYATWNVEFRRVGHQGGGWPGTFEDVRRGAAILPQLGVRTDRVLTIGHSAGGHLALWLAGQPLPFALRGAVSLAGVADLKRAAELNLGSGATQALLGGEPDEVPERYAEASPRERLPLGIKQVLVHGERDNIVPIDIVEAYAAAARAGGDTVRLHRLANTGHFELIDPLSNAWQTVLDAVDTLANQ
jgi:acetyl esterase/lipase